jgi:hypothetical protein
MKLHDFVEVIRKILGFHEALKNFIEVLRSLVKLANF